MARALLDQGHLLLPTARRWLEREIGHGWATCPIPHQRPRWRSGSVRPAAHLCLIEADGGD